MRARATLIASLAIAVSLSGTAPSAQAVRPPQSLEDKVLGWIKIYDYKGATLPIKMDRAGVLARAALHRAALCQLDAGQLSADGRPG